MSKLTHLDERGQAKMVDVTEKTVSARVALAQAKVTLSAEAFRLVQEGKHKKGDVLAIARIAGIQAAKKTSDLIPLCHPLMLTSVAVDIEALSETHQFVIQAECKLAGKTGVEMEALTAVSVAALTLYDMCKAVDKSMVIEEICLLQKSGGKSGDWRRP